MKDRRSICNFGNQRNGCFFFDGRKKHRGIPAETKHTQIWNAIRLPERSIIVLPDVEQDVEQCTADACVVTNPTTTAEPAQSQATETDNTASATAETVTSSPKTGDNSSMAVIWVLFAGCAITAFCYAKKRVRR